MANDIGKDGEIALLRQRVGELQSRNAELESIVADDRIARDLKQLIMQTGIMTAFMGQSPHRRLLQIITETAAYVLGVRGASLFILDKDADELILEAVVAERTASLRGLKIALGHGVVGFTVATGQTVSISDVDRDERWAKDVAEKIGYSPKTLLSTPLVFDEEPIGALEFMDRYDGKPFDARDLELAGRFALQATAAIQQSRVTGTLTGLIREGLGQLGEDADEFGDNAVKTVERVERMAEYQETARIAADLGKVGRSGEAGRRLCGELVSAVKRYLDTHERLSELG